jgi:hypothetical protein
MTSNSENDRSLQQKFKNILESQTFGLFMASVVIFSTVTLALESPQNVCNCHVY